MSEHETGGDAYAIVLADLHRRRDEIDAAIRAIEALSGGAPRSVSATRPPDAHSSASEPQDFLGLSIAEASKKLLASRRKTMTSAEIAEGLAAANYPMTAADPGNVVGSVLSRRFDAIGDVVRVSRGQWGLPEWYPNRSFRKKEKVGPARARESLEPLEDEAMEANRSTETSS